MFFLWGWKVKVRCGFHLPIDIKGIDIDRHWYSPVRAGCFCVLPWFRCEQFVTWLLTRRHVITCCLTTVRKMRSENQCQQLGTTSLIYGLLAEPRSPLSVASLRYDDKGWATLHRSRHPVARPLKAWAVRSVWIYHNLGSVAQLRNVPTPHSPIPLVKVSYKAGYSGVPGMRPSLPIIIGQIGLSARCARHLRFKVRCC